jgi:hypothetical protein
MIPEVTMPHFTIEAQGEAVPLTANTVYSTLIQASGGYHGLQGIKVATEQLSNWENRPGYYSALQDVYVNLSLDEQIRYQAIIQLKNGIDKHWRKGSVQAIGKDEKLRIRTTAIEAGIQEPSRSLALHNALMLAKIVRSEFPHDWPDAITTVIGYLRKASGTRQTANILIIALQIVKELATGRLQRTRKSLQQAASELFQVLGTIYVQLVEKWLAHLQAPGHNKEGAIDDVQNSYYALKTIRRLAIAGFEHPHRENVVQQLWTVLSQQQLDFLAIWHQTAHGKETYVDDVVVKHLFQMSKLHLEMARNHPASFSLLNGADLVGRYWSAVTELGHKFSTEMTSMQSWEGWKVRNDGDKIGEVPPLEKLALKALLLLRACIKMVYQPTQTFKYQQPQDKEDKKSAIDLMKLRVLTEPFVLSMMEVMVTQFFVLRPSDLRDWEEEPDEWEKREEEVADAWEFSLRSCSEKLFLDLIINYKELLVPRLLQVFYQYASPSNTEIFLKDSLYSAIGIAAACLEDKLDFNAFLLQTLAAEVQISQPHYNLLRRRIAIVLGQWVPVKPESLDRPTIYRIFTHLLLKNDERNDMVVRVTAGRQLRLVLEPFEFRHSEFAPFAPPIFQGLMLLIQETELSETKMALLETVRVAVTKLEGHIEPYSDAIMSMLPPLWAESGEENLIKQAILTMITAITTSLKEKSLKYHQLILPLIRDSVDPDSETAVYLLEDGLDLWTAILQQTPTTNPPPSAELLGLATSLVPLAELGSDSFRPVLELLESYILLSPQIVLSINVLDPLLRALSPVFAEDSRTRLSDFQKTSDVLQTLIAAISLPAIPTDSREQALTHLVSSMMSTQFLPTIINSIRSAYTYHQDPRPSRKPPDVTGPKETSLFSLLSHIAIQSPSTFLAFLEENAQWLILEWISNFDAVGNIQDKKLQTIAITTLLSGRPPAFMLEQLQSLMTIWTDICTALGDEAPEESQGDYLWYGYSSDERPPWTDEAQEEERRRALSRENPVHRINIRAFIRGKLREVIDSVGLEAFQQMWLTRIDGAVISAFGDLSLL